MPLAYYEYTKGGKPTRSRSVNTYIIPYLLRNVKSFGGNFHAIYDKKTVSAAQKAFTDT